MKPGFARYRDILLTGVASAMFLLEQSALGQEGSAFRPMPNGAEVTAAQAAADKEAKEGKMTGKKDRFTYGKRHETSVTTESANGTIQKTKEGSSDATVSTGVFKESFLDVGLSSGRAPASSPTRTAPVNPVRGAATAAQSSTSPQPSPSPAATAAAALTPPPRLDITLGVSPAPTITATPKPQ
jgi:hypothetical protein